MMQIIEERWWVKICLKSIRQIPEIQKEYKVEIFNPTLRRIDHRNWLVEGYIPKRLYKDLKLKCSVQILGDVGKIVKEASKYISKINRYKKI
jgi:hypothetical protein